MGAPAGRRRGGARSGVAAQKSFVRHQELSTVVSRVSDLDNGEDRVYRISGGSADACGRCTVMTYGDDFIAVGDTHRHWISWMSHWRSSLCSRI